jgi:hypothetical protein
MLLMQKSRKPKSLLQQEGYGETGIQWNEVGKINTLKPHVSISTNFKSVVLIQINKLTKKKL